MKKLLKDKFFGWLLLVMVLLISCNSKKNNSAQEVKKYTCPMHPEIVKEAPGSCPICGMDLVLIKAHQKGTDTLSSLLKDDQADVNIKIIRPVSGSKFTEASLNGVINYNTNSFKTISARVSGRVEKLFLKYNYQPVVKGQKIMEIYSPDLANAEQELLFLKNNNEAVLMEAAKRKLRLLGVSDQQINQVLKTGKVDYSIPVISPYSGFLTEVSNSTVSQSASNSTTGGTSISSSGSSSMGSMGSSASTETIPSAPDVNTKTPVLLKEGQYVSTGQKLFNLVSTENVWAEFFVTPEIAQQVKRGSGIRIKSKDQEGKTQRAFVSLVQPFYKEGTNYILARATIANSNTVWRIGELIDVIVENTRQKGNWLPKTAVLSLGTRYVVFVKKETGFVPVYVSVRNIASDAVDRGNSLNEEVEVAENAWFLIDSESFIKPEKLP